jgi:hypothetical protein
MRASILEKETAQWRGVFCLSGLSLMFASKPDNNNFWVVFILERRTVSLCNTYNSESYYLFWAMEANKASTKAVLVCSVAATDTGVFP